MAKPFKVVTNSDSGDADHYGGNDIDNISQFLNAQSDFHTYDYFIYKSGSTYYAKNGTTGVVDYSGSSFYTVITSVISALSSGGLIQLGAGDFSLTTQLVVTQNNIKIRGMGVDITRILYDQSSQTIAGFKVTGSIDSNKSLTANAAVGATTVIVASTTGIAAGDWIYLVRNVSVDSTSATSYDAEIHEVLSVTSTDIVLKNKIYAAYNTADSARVNKITWAKNFQLEDLTLYDNRSTLTDMTEQADSLFLFCYGVKINKVKFENMAFASCAVQNCFNSTLNNVSFESPRFLSGGGINYGLYVISATTNLTVNGAWATRCRHSFTTGTIGGSQATTYGPGRQRNIVCNNFTSWNANTADFDTHEGTVGMIFNACGALGGDPDAGLQTDTKGFNTRSPTIFNSCWTEGSYGVCSVVFRGTVAAGTADIPGGDRTQYNSCRFSSPQAGPSDMNGIVIEGSRTSVSINNCLFYNIADKPIKIDDGVSHVVISNNIFDSCSSNNTSSEGIIHCVGTVTDLTVTGNDFSAGTPPANSVPLYITTGAGTSRVIFSNNNLNGLTNIFPVIPNSTNIVTIGNIPTLSIENVLPRTDKAKWGQWIGGAATSGDGLFNGRLSSIAVGTGTDSGQLDSSGFYRLYDTGATINSLTGLRLNSLTTERILNCYFKTAIYLNSISNVRIFAGFVNSGSAPASAADPLNALAGVGLWFDSAVNANWRRLHNDSSGASISDDTSLTVATGTLYPVEIYAVTDSKFRFVFNNVITDISSDIPASTTNLAWWFYIENTTGASRTMRCYYVTMRSDK